MTAALGLAAVLAAASLLWLLSVRLRDASIADIGWGPGFVLVAWTYAAAAPALGGRSWLALALVTIWGARLAVHLLRRKRGHGEDPRYAAMRERSGASFWWRSLYIVFGLQAVLVWIVAMPLLVAIRSSSALTLLDLAGVLLFVVGFSFEAVGDCQLVRFKADPSNRGRVLDTGLWRYSRHPNYFGDATLWWGLYLIGAAAGGWWTAFGPAVMTVLLLRVSGVTLLERGLTRTKPGYADYVARTPAFFPWFPRVTRSDRRSS